MNETTRYTISDLAFVFPPWEGRECEDDYGNHAHKADWFDADIPEGGATLEWLREHYIGVDAYGVGLTILGEAPDLLGEGQAPDPAGVALWEDSTHD